MEVAVGHSTDPYSRAFSFEIRMMEVGALRDVISVSCKLFYCLWHVVEDSIA